MAITLTLTDQQQALLTDTLQNALGDLSYEIANTDSSTYKQTLKEKREVLKSIADQLPSS